MKQARCVLKNEVNGKFWPKIGDDEANGYETGSKICD